MNRFASTLLCLAVALTSSSVIGQTKIKKDQLVGTWRYTSVTVERPDGSKVEPWGPNLSGFLVFTSNGRYSATLLRADVPQLASKDRLKTTPEENQAIAHGVLSSFGTYSVNEAEGTFTLHVEASTFAGDNGTDQKRIVTSVSKDELKWTNPTPTTSGKAYAVVKRLN